VELFFNGKFGGLGPPSLNWATRPGSMVDRGGADKRARRHLASAQRVGARPHRCSSVAVEGGEPDEAVREGCSSEHKRRQKGGVTPKKTGGGLSSLRGLRKARGTSGARRERGGEGRGCSGVYIGGQGAPGRGNDQW
jgi:hypothetical protein